MRDLLKKAKLGDKKAKELIIMACKPLIIKTYRSVELIDYDKEDIEQICVMVILNVIEKIDINRGDKLLGYIKKSIQNQMIDLKRRRNVKEKYEKVVMVEVAENRASIEEEILEKDLIKILIKIVKNLSYEEKLLFKIVFLNEKPLTRYADIRKMSYIDAYKLKQRVTRVLRENIK